ncbi:MAG: MBL fold metallo-hydrolase [bacterium]
MPIPQDVEIKKLVLGLLENNTYIVFHKKTKDTIIIDPADNPELIVKLIRNSKLKPLYVLLTHGHGDHIGAVNGLKEEFDVKIAVHSLDSAMILSPELNLSINHGCPVSTGKADVILGDGDTLKIGDIEFKVIHTPGHSQGGISLYHPGILFSGDTLFKGDVGRYDLPGSDVNDLFKSLQKLMSLPDETIVYPGHGPSTTISQEKRLNYSFKEISKSI